jgi:hypothetical protein
VTHRHIRAGKQGDKRNTTQNTLDDETKHFIEKIIYRKYTTFPSRISPKEENVYYISSKETKLQEKAKFYATSVAGSMAVEGAEESEAALGGGIEELGAGVDELGAGVKEAAEGVIRDTMPGAYSFAFLKNPSSFETGRAWEELILSQSSSLPCD